MRRAKYGAQVLARRLMAGAMAGCVLMPMLACAKAPPVVTYGKPDVAYEAYKQDAVDCGVKGYLSDIEKTKQVEALKAGTRRLEALDGVDQASGPAIGAAPGGGATPGDAVGAAVNHAREVEQVRASVQPEKQMAELKKLMERRVGQCLIARGYTRFTLSDDQSKALGKLRRGSEERRRFLYALARDGAIIAAQKLADD